MNLNLLLVLLAREEINGKTAKYGVTHILPAPLLLQLRAWERLIGLV